MKKVLLLLAFCIGIAIVVVGNAQLRSNTASSNGDNPFDPRRYGIPDYLAGYKVWAVTDSRTQACLPADHWVVYVQVEPHAFPTPLTGSPALMDEIKRLSESLHVELSLSTRSGPYDIVVFADHMARWNAMNADGCIQLGPMLIITPGP